MSKLNGNLKHIELRVSLLADNAERFLIGTSDGLISKLLNAVTVPVALGRGCRSYSHLFATISLDRMRHDVLGGGLERFAR